MMNAVIMLSTFNGQPFLKRLLDSLSAQSESFTILWRDDGSSDETKNIVRCHGFGQLVELEHSAIGQPLGPALSFGELLEGARGYSNAIFFFCDQDDIWETGKVRRILKEFAQETNDTPRLLIHDAACIDEYGKVLPRTINHGGHKTYAHYVLPSLLVNNTAAGCCMAFNAPALNVATPLTDRVVMHDWWMAVLIAAVGEINHIAEPLIRYRLHASNTVGFKTWGDKICHAGGLLPLLKQEERAFHMLFLQSGELARRASGKCKADKDLRLILRFSKMGSYSLIGGLVAAMWLLKGVGWRARFRFSLKLILWRPPIVD